MTTCRLMGRIGGGPAATRVPGAAIALAVAAVLLLAPRPAVARPAAKSTPQGRPATAAGAAAPATAAEAAARLRALFFAHDYEGGRTEGERLVERFPDDTEVRAWRVLNLAEDRRNEDAVTEAEALGAAHPQSPWTWFALAGALMHEDEREREALKASRWALSSMPENPDAVWLRAKTLERRYKMQRAVAFAEKWRARLENPAELMALEAGALYGLAYGAEPPDQEQVARANALFEEARRLDPRNVSAPYLHGLYLAHFAGRHADAHPILKRAAELSPLSTAVHREYWQAVMGRRDLGREQKHAEIEADLRRLLEARGDSPGLLYAAKVIYGQMKRNGRRDALEKRILAEAPLSREAEYILAGRLEEFEEKSARGQLTDPRKRATYRRLLREYVARPKHRGDYTLAWAYRALLRLERDDPSMSAGETLEAVRAMARRSAGSASEFYAAGVAALAERKAYFREAEAIAREGLEKVREEVAAAGWYDNADQRRRALDRQQAGIHDALGWLYFHEGRPRDAEEALLDAHDLDPEMKENLYHLGRLYETRGNLKEAERFYVKGVVVQDPGVNPSLKALKDLYARTHPGADGFDAWLEKATDPDRDRRKSEILRARLVEPQPIPAFALQTLDGRRVSSDSLKGKVVVINFWGLWCGWCLEEMPDIQRLHERYRDDPQVRVLTIDNDQNPDSVRDWMRERKYDFPVLLDEAYVTEKAGITGFPHTWFIDRDGRKAFEQSGWSKYLVEEYAWRIEALRDGVPGGAPGGG